MSKNPGKNEHCIPEPIQEMIEWYKSEDIKKELITAWCVKYIKCRDG